MGSWFIRRANVVYGESPSPPAPIYVTDGLIFHLDGIDKGDTANAWTDIVSGTAITGTDVISTQYGWEFDGNGHFRADNIVIGSENQTLEVCFKPYSTGTYCLLAFGSNSATYNLIFYKSGNTITWAQKSNTFTFTLNANTAYSLSMNLDAGMCNGTPVSKNSGTDYWSNDNYLRIGKRSSGNAFTGEIYSIRVYNRRLTAAEQLNNFNVDNARFNLVV